MQSTTVTFKEIVANVEQQECIDILQGPVMVLAGPGTGKTTTVIKRIEHMLNQGIEPSSILALTFSEAAATEMKVRLLKQVGIKASSVVINTYHAFCSDLISQHSLKFELLEEFNVIDALNKNNLMRDVIDEFRPKHLVTRRSDPYYYVSFLINAIHDIKLNRITKEKYFSTLETHKNWLPALKGLEVDREIQEELQAAGKRNHLKTCLKEIETLEAQIKKAREIWEIYEKYCKKMNQRGYIDFDDMINFVLDMFEEDPLFLEQIRSQYQYILVDEYQDTNHSQNELIFKLASENPDTNLFVVADDDQIIYAFQGAQIDNLERFLNLYPEARVICLKENNRSSQTILDFSRNIIMQDSARLENNPAFERYKISKKLLAKNVRILEKDTPVELHIFSDIIQENNYISDRIQSIIESNPELPLNEIAVLARTNAELESFTDLLKARNIPSQITKQKDIFSLKPSLLIYLYLKTLENHERYAMSLFGLVAHPPFNFDVSDYSFMLKESQVTGSDFITLIRKNHTKHNWKNPETIHKFIATFEELKASINDDTLTNLIIHLINKTGLLEYYAAKRQNKFDNIASIKKMVDEIRAFEKITKPATLTMLLDYLDNSLRDKINLPIEENTFIENAVQLTTLHKSKGREFSYVFMPNLNAKNWEKKRTMDVLKVPVDRVEFTKESEIARLLFVGCSRSRYGLILSHSNMQNGKNTELSNFIRVAAEDDTLVKKVEHPLDSDKYLDELISHFVQPAVYQEASFLNDLKQRAQSHIMSPSSLYLYHLCPKQFMYSYIYRIPQLETVKAALSFGSAIHKALEKFIKAAVKTSAYPAKDKLLQYFHQAMDKTLFPSRQEREIRLNHGNKVLNAYYSSLVSASLLDITGVEINLNFVPVEKYFVKGKIDRIDRVSPSEYRVIDYKTGNPKYKNQVIAPDGSHRNYFDQLSLYKLMIETQNSSQNVTEGMLLFLEEPEKSLRFELTEDDKKNIKDKVILTFEKIHALEFTGVDEVNQFADPCKECVYKFLCKLNTL
jgi:DNA helicase-2/ATP-dependent DNA helicase PcrA